MTSWMHGSFPGHEVNIVFSRGLSLDALTTGLRELRREPLAHGEADGWAWAVHDMLNGEIEDYDGVDYRRICTQGTELVVFVTEPCSAKAHGPAFDYYRDGRLTLGFSFEDVGQRVGENPDHLSAELLTAGLIGPEAYCESADTDDDHDCFDHHHDDEDRLVRTIADAFGLPSPPLAREVVREAGAPIAPGTFVTYAKGLDLPTLATVLAEAGYPARTQGESAGWSWATHDAAALPGRGTAVADLARDITGFRYEERFGGPGRVETVFLATTPACECPHGQHYMVPHCPEHPFQFLHCRGGFEESYFNVGRRRESRRSGDLLLRELLNAGIVGRNTPAYDADPGFNADGAVTRRIIMDHFGLPAPS
ncbi:hypothetical protein [Streptomyces sp. ML-6]|uniref:hypothetical protein n=1 Tax=Streptomyces sp. ML-6 TaxID=2982693 RepID=UPI0024C03BB5|nr:hypothetical protein [Streptomyces sp. ML-6]MDK0521195.1 hypothetical protein [Streptomyces sp. ML-6]